MDSFLSTLAIPSEFGSITEISEGNAPFILLILDVPVKYDTQKDIAAVLEHLIQKYGLYLVLVEGGSKNDSLAHLRSTATPEKRRQVADQFLQEGKISGENYLDIVSDYNFLVYGVENPDLYNADVFTRDPRISFKREEAMVENSLKRIKEFNVNFAVLIAGGWHKPGLTALLRQKQIAYAIIVPKHHAFTKDDRKRMDKVLQETFIPMKKE